MLLQRDLQLGKCEVNPSLRIDAILSASEIRQDEIRLRPELSDGTTSVRCHKNWVSKYVSPSTLANISKRVNDDNESDDPEVGTKRMRSSTACAFEFMKHCLFCPNVTTWKLLHEYDDKVPHQYRIRFFSSEFVLSRGKVLGLDWYRRNQGPRL